MTSKNPIQIVLNENEQKSDMNDISIIKSQTKYEIMELLRYNEMNFEEIVENVAKSKATISSHLKSLREDNIVKYKPQPQDNRKKIFYSNSKIIGTVNPLELKKTEDSQSKVILNNILDENQLDSIIRLIHSFKLILIEFGIEIDYILTEIGKYIGSYIFNKVNDEDLEIFCDNISEYWKNNNLNELSFEFNDMIKISYDFNQDYIDLPKSGKPSCFLEKGIFEELFSRFFKFKVNVLEVQCYSMGDNQCVFDVEP